MTKANIPVTLRVGIDESLDAWGPEIKYVLRTLLRLAGFAHEFVWIQGADPGERLDIYYGPKTEIDARINITSCGRSFAAAPQMEVRTVSETDGISFLNFCETNGHEGYRSSNATLNFSNDIVFACFWLLTGAPETRYQRDKWDNFKLDGSSFLENSLAAKPLVSVYGLLVRKFFKELGYEPRELPWITRGVRAAFVLSHDVDYPQIVRSIECLRLLKSRGLKSLPSIKGVLNGTNNFWKFADWVEFEKRLGARSAFYFMARKGSLIQYAAGTPDGFYDIRSTEFAELFRYLKDEGCEIGLHASYNAYQDVEQLRREKASLEEAAGVRVEGNRHHYWRLDPAAPHDTLLKHEQVGLVYDSSLAFEFYPGFRRGICHPFRIFHSGQRRELDLVELPPAWMDDHFDRRLTENQIVEPETYARQLVETAQKTNGVVVVDYHPRGMNSDFYPRYGAWLQRFIEKHLDSSVVFRKPREIVLDYLRYEKLLEEHSRDRTNETVQLAVKTEKLQVLTQKERVDVDVIGPDEYESWDNFVGSHPNGLIYHTTAWKSVTEESFGHRNFLLAAHSNDKIVGILPLYLVNGISAAELVSVPLRDRGGPLFDEYQTCELLVRKAIELSQKTGAKRLRFKFPSQDSSKLLKSMGFQEEHYWMTTVVPLVEDPEQIWNSVLRSPTRRAVKKARNAGLQVRWTVDPHDIARFYQVFLKTRKQLGIPPYPERLFRSIHERLVTQGLAKLLLVEKDHRPVAGLFIFTYKDEVTSAYMGSDPRLAEMRPNDLLFWEAIRWSAEAGYKRFYFGADSPHQEGLLTFKRKWGGEQFVIPNFQYSVNGSAMKELDSCDPGVAIYRQLLSLAPMPLFRLAGELLTRRLS